VTADAIEETSIRRYSVAMISRDNRIPPRAHFKGLHALFSHARLSKLTSPEIVARSGRDFSSKEIFRRRAAGERAISVPAMSSSVSTQPARLSPKSDMINTPCARARDAPIDSPRQMDRYLIYHFRESWRALSARERTVAAAVNNIAPVRPRNK